MGNGYLSFLLLLIEVKEVTAEGADHTYTRNRRLSCSEKAELRHSGKRKKEREEVEGEEEGEEEGKGVAFLLDELLIDIFSEVNGDILREKRLDDRCQRGGEGRRRRGEKEKRRKGEGGVEEEREGRSGLCYLLSQVK